MTTPEPVRRRVITLREGEGLPVDDVVITIRRIHRVRVEVEVEAPRDVAIGEIRRAGEQPS